MHASLPVYVQVRAVCVCVGGIGICRSLLRTHHIFVEIESKRNKSVCASEILLVCVLFPLHVCECPLSAFASTVAVLLLDVHVQ